MAEKSAPKPPPGSAGGEPVPFDQRLARLEAIVAELESGGLSLEPAIDRYQEGVTLLRECRAILAGYKQRVEELSADGALAPYAGDPDAGDEDAR